MRPLDYILVLLGIVSIVAGSLSYIQAEEQPQELTAADSSADAMATAERLDELTDEIATLKRRSLVAADLARLAAEKASAQELRNLQDKVDQLQAALAAEVPAGLKMKVTEGGEEQLVAVEDYIEKRIAAATKVTASNERKRRFKDAVPFIKVGMKRQLDKFVKKLNLNETQKEQMETSFNEAMDKTLPQMSVILDRETPAEERSEAIATVQSTMSEVSTQASSYLDPEQYTQFTQMQQQQMQGLNTLLTAGQNMNSSSGSGGGGGN